MSSTFFDAVFEVFLLSDPLLKKEGIRLLYEQLSTITSSVQKINFSCSPPPYPTHLKLVSPQQVARRALSTPEGRAALVHALAHIEWNAIHLALDAILRFQDLPLPYYQDWLKVADDEIRHFLALEQHLNGLGFTYGDFPAHGGLWEMAQDSQGDVLERMALVPRLLEARGLDVTPGIIHKVRSFHDKPLVAILEMIYEEEKEHVRIGNYWFHYLCKVRNVEPVAYFSAILQQKAKAKIKKPFNHQARLEAGFSEIELQLLEQL